MLNKFLHKQQHSVSEAPAGGPPLFVPPEEKYSHLNRKQRRKLARQKKAEVKFKKKRVASIQRKLDSLIGEDQEKLIQKLIKKKIIKRRKKMSNEFHAGIKRIKLLSIGLGIVLTGTAICLAFSLFSFYKANDTAVVVLLVISSVGAFAVAYIGRLVRDLSEAIGEYLK